MRIAGDFIATNNGADTSPSTATETKTGATALNAFSVGRQRPCRCWIFYSDSSDYISSGTHPLFQAIIWAL
jgi:hypothetical protein